jgi:phenylalanyl-tRNA synthetase beta chain
VTCEALLAAGGCERILRFEPVSAPALHPGQTAHRPATATPWAYSVRCIRRLQKALGFDRPVWWRSSTWMPADRLRAGIQPVSRFPAVRRDIAVVVDAGVPVGNCWQSADARQAAYDAVNAF